MLVLKWTYFLFKLKWYDKELTPFSLSLFLSFRCLFDCISPLYTSYTPKHLGKGSALWATLNYRPHWKDSLLRWLA